MIKKHLNKIITILLIAILIFWVQEMTASSLLERNRIGSFTVVFIPIIILFLLAFLLIRKYRKSKYKSKKYLLLALMIFPVLLVFLWFTFGQKNSSCYSGNCINGKGIGLYISSERSSVDVESGDTSYNTGQILGYAFFNNISWYDGNPIDEIYVGEYKNGRFHGKGEIYRFTYEYDNLTYEPIKINGGFIYKGEFENGWLLWDKPTREYYEFDEDFAVGLLKTYGLDIMGFRK
jgi:energy-coupling factor transporter transmembrane protein EcfT